MAKLAIRSSRQRRRVVGIAGASLVAGLVLVGCSSATPDSTIGTSPTPSTSSTPSSTPTPTQAPAPEVAIAEAPQSAEEAIDAASVSAQTYLDMRAYIETNHPDDASAIDTIATGDAAADVRLYLAHQLENGFTKSGSYNFDVTQSSTAYLNTSDGTQYPFGAVTLDGCFSSEQLMTLNADGTPAETNPNKRGLLSFAVAYFPKEKHWIVTNLVPAMTENREC